MLPTMNDDNCTMYQVLKNGVPVATTSDPDEADDLYLKYEADEIREIFA